MPQADGAPDARRAARAWWSRFREETATRCAANIASLETVHCGPAGHLAPEDQPEAIAMALTSWAERHGFGSSAG
ncbi:hypothetical protein [Streptomyces sp. NPDC005969]|uniref:hypothetical protein n=1 Tax=Streptomyces sp. NPDC005969 TaxID=3156722 RepID=UPI0033F44036